MDITEMVFYLFALLVGLGVWKDSRPLLIAGGFVGIVAGALFFMADSLVAAGLLVIVGAYFVFSGVEQ